MFTESLTYPLRGGHALKTIVIGSALSLLGFLVIPVVFVLGYVVRVARSVSDGDDTLPHFADWRTLFVDGVKLLGILLAYFLPPFVLIVFGIASRFARPDVGLDRDLVGSILGVLGILGFVAFLAVSYAAPVGIVNFARTSRARNAFSVRGSWPVLRSRSYGVAWLLAFAVVLLANALTGVLFATLLGSVLAAVVFFYASVASAYLYARGCSEARPVA